MQTIIAVDLIDSRLVSSIRSTLNALISLQTKAKEHGATHTINAKAVDTTEEVMKLTNGKGVDYAIEATGVARAAEAAFFSLGKRGKMVCSLCSMIELAYASDKVQIGDNAAGNLSLPVSLQCWCSKGLTHQIARRLSLSLSHNRRMR